MLCLYFFIFFCLNIRFFLYKNKDIDISNLKLQTEEVSEVKWVDKDEIIKRVKNHYDGITDNEGCWEYLVKYYEWLDNQ